MLTFICPEALQKLSGKSLSFKDLANFISKATAASVGKTVYLKLIGNKTNHPRFPYFLSFFEGQSEPAITNNFISDNENTLGFTEYELSQKKRIEEAKPTDMATKAPANNPDKADEESVNDLDLDLL